ncbi:acyltransferase [Burkholderia sp. RF4-BP95]|uniref:acyltransferase family protein n=1 Tax=Burkholderia sp. RF4-BP95 TaxID=1637845 RepID=UPI000758F256|nr:acyltransferase [Burkholderia sp. RF4-BP95]KUY70914.1 acyltransferase [Burkholderia sp. RF4-BP95]
MNASDTRDDAIDLLRGLSILLVLLHHFNIAYSLGDTTLAGLLGWPLLRAIARNGNYGVTIFFAISGFLITRNSLERWGRLDAIRTVSFWRLRFARILPMLVLTLAAVDALALAGLPLFGNRAASTVPLWTTNAAALGAWMNVLVIREGWINYPLGVMWSLSVEMAFYLLFPLACVLLRRSTRLALLAAVLVVAGPLYRLANQGNGEAYLYGYLACFDAIAIGCCAGVLARRRTWPALQRPYVRPLIGIAMTLLYLMWPISQSNILGVSAMALGSALLLLGRAAARHSSPGLARRILTRCGRDCYEIYLLHLLVLGLLRTWLPPAQLLSDARLGLLLAYFAGSCLLGTLVSRGYSTPLNRWLRQRSGVVFRATR